VILRSAKKILAAQPNANVEEIATAAGVSRQTVYAHFRTREALISAVIDEITVEAVVEMDAAHLDEGSAAAALLRLLDASWRTLQRYPQLMSAAATAADPEADHTRHQAVFDRLNGVLTRGQRSGEFARDLDISWLATAVIALGHAAGDAVSAERMTLAEATTALATAVLRVCGVAPSEITKVVGTSPTG
jgi:AcrR family transcriptional regulator